ncbi:hypothetical protein [Gardnerella vaginalis]|uniref:hypothetical protein n=1 Tax=Gardnerella vaginalis TaxID=2702 RepID=UPI0002F732AA
MIIIIAIILTRAQIRQPEDALKNIAIIGIAAGGIWFLLADKTSCKYWKNCMKAANTRSRWQ